MVRQAAFGNTRGTKTAVIGALGTALGLLLLVPTTRAYTVWVTLALALLMGPIVVFGGVGLVLGGRVGLRSASYLLSGLACAIATVVSYPLAQLVGMTTLGWTFFLGGFGTNVCAVLCAVRAFDRAHSESERYEPPMYPWRS